MNRQPRSWAASALGFALTVLAACWALNLAATLVMEVLPVLVGLGVIAALAVGGLHLLRRRGSGW